MERNFIEVRGFIEPKNTYKIYFNPEDCRKIKSDQSIKTAIDIFSNYRNSMDISTGPGFEIITNDGSIEPHYFSGTYRVKVSKEEWFNNLTSDEKIKAAWNL